MEFVLATYVVLWGAVIWAATISVQIGVRWMRESKREIPELKPTSEVWAPAGYLCPVLDVFSANQGGLEESGAILFQAERGGSFVAAWEVQGAYTRFADGEMLNQVTRSLEHILSNQRELVTLQFRIDRVRFKGEVDIGNNDRAEPGVRWLRENRQNYFRALPISEIRLTVFMSFPMVNLPGVRLKRRPWYQKSIVEGISDFLTDKIEYDAEIFDASVKEFEKLVQQFESDLLQVSTFRRLGVRDCIERMYQDLNPGRPVRGDIKQSGQKDLQGQMAQSPVVDEGWHLQVGNHHLVRVLSSVEGCDGTKPFMLRDVLSGLGGVPGDFTFLLTVHYPNQEKTFRHLQKVQRRSALAVSSSPGHVNQRARTQFQEIDELVYEAERGAKYLYGTFQVRLNARFDGEAEGKAQALNELQMAANLVVSVFRKISCEMVEENVDLLPQWRNGLWGVCPSNARYREFYMLSSHLSHLVLLESRFLGEGMRPVVVFRSDTDELVRFDPRDPRHVSYNGIILGASGSGKSTLMLEIAKSLMVFYPQIPTIIIDKGGSAYPLCKVLDGAFCAIEKNHTVNPFDHPDFSFGKVPPSGHLEAVTKFYSFLLGLHCQPDYTYRHTLLLDAVRSVFELKLGIGIMPKTRDLLMVCNHKKQGEDGEIYREFATGLREYAHAGGDLRGDDGTYAKFLDVQTAEDLITTGRLLVVWDLQSLSELPDNLREAFSFLITYRTLALDQQFEVDTNGVAAVQPRNVFIDEVWSILSKNMILRDFLLELVKTKRKSGMTVWLATQDIQNFFGGHDIRHSEPEAASLIRNATFKFIGVHEGNLDVLAVALQLTGVEKATIERFRRRYGQFHPFLFKIGGGDDVTTYIKVDYSSVEYWTWTTAFHERRLREDLVARYLSQNYSEQIAYIKAITELAKRYPRGIQEATKS